MKVLAPQKYSVVSDQVVYINDLHTVLPGLNDQPGVYIIINTETGQEYVGSSTCLADRLGRYLQPWYLTLLLSLSLDIIIQGRDKFLIRIIVVDKVENSLLLEQYFLDTCAMEYNGTRKARNQALGFYKFYIYCAVTCTFLFFLTGPEFYTFFDMSQSFNLNVFTSFFFINKKKE